MDFEGRRVGRQQVLHEGEGSSRRVSADHHVHRRVDFDHGADGGLQPMFLNFYSLSLMQT
jgi:hypothetical protein